MDGVTYIGGINLWVERPERPMRNLGGLCLDHLVGDSVNFLDLVVREGEVLVRPLWVRHIIDLDLCLRHDTEIVTRPSHSPE